RGDGVRRVQSGGEVLAQRRRPLWPQHGSGAGEHGGAEALRGGPGGDEEVDDRAVELVGLSGVDQALDPSEVEAGVLGRAQHPSGELLDGVATGEVGTDVDGPQAGDALGAAGGALPTMVRTR